jgi:hypothetical protein
MRTAWAWGNVLGELQNLIRDRKAQFLQQDLVEIVDFGVSFWHAGIAADAIAAVCAQSASIDIQQQQLEFALPGIYDL